MADYDHRFAFTQAGEVTHKHVVVFGIGMSYDHMADIGPRSQDEVHRVYYQLDDIGVRRQPHHSFWRERFAAPLPAPENPTPVEAMAWRLQTPHGKQLYGLRKQTPEPVFGIIKSVIGFRQFLLRGLDRVRGEWSLVTMAWNIKRMYALSLG